MTATEAARSFSDVLNRVAAGEEIEVTRAGAPVATISPPKTRLPSAAHLIGRASLLRRAQPRRRRRGDRGDPPRRPGRDDQPAENAAAVCRALSRADCRRA